LAGFSLKINIHRVTACGVAHWRVGPRSVGRNSGPIRCRDAW